MVYILSLEPQFDPFLKDTCTWSKKSASRQHRGLTNDGEDVPQAWRSTTEEKNAMLELLLGQIELLELLLGQTIDPLSHIVP